MTRSDPGIVLDLIEAFRRSQTMFTAALLGVFDRLDRGPADLATLALEAGADASALERLLDGCRGLGLIEKVDGCYANLPPARDYLVRSSPTTLAGYVLYSTKVLFPLWLNLAGAVREGTHRWKESFGLDGPIFSHFFKTAEDMSDFLTGMHGLGLLSSPAVAAAFDLGRFRRIVDLGGATGHLAVAACERYPELRGAVLDLPGVIEIARRCVARSPACLRIELVEADFFTDPLPEADLFALGRILHDWSEEKITRLLAKIHAALPEGGAVLIAEKVLDEDKGGPLAALMQSLNMLVCTEGRERTLEEYRTLLSGAGFSRIECVRTGAPLDAILALKLSGRS